MNSNPLTPRMQMNKDLLVQPTTNKGVFDASLSLSHHSI